MPLIKEKAFIYSLRSGELEIHEGFIRETADPNYGYFITSTDINPKRYRCSSKSGIICNTSLWLPERDDKLAKKILNVSEKKIFRKEK